MVTHHVLQIIHNGTKVETKIYRAFGHDFVSLGAWWLGIKILHTFGIVKGTEVLKTCTAMLKEFLG